MRQEDLESAIEELITMEDLLEIFQVSRQALFRWRQKGLSELEIRIPNNPRSEGPNPRDLIRFQEKAVLRWAARNGYKTPGLDLWRVRSAKRDADAA